MSLSRLAAKCRACPKVDICDHKQMEALGALPIPENRTVEVNINLETSITLPQPRQSLKQFLEAYYGQVREKQIFR